MKRFLTILCALGIATPLGADIKYNEYTNTFYSYPLNNSVDQLEYSILLMRIRSLIIQHTEHKKSEKEIAAHITSYLKTLNTQISWRLLADLEKNGFFPYVFAIGIELVSLAGKTNYRQELRETYAKNPNIKANDIEEYVDIHIQLILMIYTCWRNGIYGKDIDNQIVSYLKASNTPAALHFLQCFKN